MSETKNLKLFKHDEPLESNENEFDIDKALNQNWDKVDEYVEQLNTDINSLQEENTKSKEEITNIKEEQETQNANIEENENKIVELQKENIELKEENSRLKEDLNAFPTVKASGEYVTLDTADSRFKDFKIFGKSEQETGDGIPSVEKPSKIRNVGDNINIFNKNAIFRTNGAKVEVLDTGIRVIDIAGAKFDYVSTVLGKEELLGETVTAYSDLLATAGTYPGILLYFGTDAAPTSGGVIQKINSNSPNAGKWKIPSEFPNGSDTIRIYFYVGDIKPAPVGGRVDYTNLKVEIGETPSPYSEHGYGNLKVIISNENLGNAEQLYNEMNTFNPNNVRKEIVDGKNCIVFANSSFRIANGFKGLNGRYKTNTRYFIRAKARAYDKTLKDSYALYIQSHNKDGEEIGTDSHVANAGNWTQFSFLTNADSSLEYIDFSYGNSAYWCLDMDSLEIYEATKVKDVENNKETNIVFPFEPGQKLMQRDYLAEDGTHHKRKQIVLDGTEAWNYDAMGDKMNNTTCFRMEIEDYIGNDGTFAAIGNLKSNYFVEQSIYANDLEGMRGGFGKYIFLKLNKKNLAENTVNGFKAWLKSLYDAEKPIAIEYELAEEEVEEYTEEQAEAYKQIQNARSYEGQTNIFGLGGTSPVFEVTARRNLNTLFAGGDT